MIKMIAAVSTNGVIGVDGGIPWMGKYPSDMAFFRKMTKGAIVIMGRKTYQSFPAGPLSGRENRVVASKPYEEVSIGFFPPTSKANYPSLQAALDAPNPDNKDVWLIGGESIYSEGLRHVGEVYLTLIPEMVETASKSVARFPFMHPTEWSCTPKLMHDMLPAPVEPRTERSLVVAIYRPDPHNEWR
jgi:dihydrofolate reductase